MLHKRWGFVAFLVARFATGLFAGTNPIFKACQALKAFALLPGLLGRCGAS